MPRGFRFPDIDKLERALAVRGWTRERLAEETGLRYSTVCRAVAGKPVSVQTIEAIARALLANPPDTATSQFLASDA